eukprot:CAMPEP_0113456516 /NCGR_PEP_ID=MMETSP0014_2-20120614/8928_1 /TAXON_ID=2857 /ORGANISM="Nitzschia sp." /LENGTH=308 /DNA_ID=CAMNT_0000347973 /DNA_START=894 /DNA_END=1820 /DNA_ORIENTATION=+ /assembly_acc=CAM_ASM_000159
MSVSSITSNNLTRSLVRPSKIANALDWRKMAGSTVLSLDIHADRIGIALAGHPSSTQRKNNTTTTTTTSSTTTSTNSVYHVESLPLHQVHSECKMKKTGQVPSEVRQRLSDIVKTHNVCGFVVSWPIQKDTGRLGASCGRTLHTLEQLLSLSQPPTQPQQSESSSKPTATTAAAGTTTIFSPSRPICLWDSTHSAKNQPRVDGFGRSTAFSYSPSSSTTSSSLPPPPTTHSARQLQYHQDETISAEQVWDDFARNFWPEQLEQVQQAPQRQQPQQQQPHRQHKNQHRSQYQEPECDDLSSIPSLAFAA